MSTKIFTALTIATAAAAGITALALHAPPKTVDCSCDEHAVIEVLPPKPVYDFHYVKPDYGHHHFAQPPAPEPPSPAPVA